MLKYKSQKGFTIVELLIVIVVIGILAALVLNTFSGVQRRARDTQRQTDVNSVATQLEVYYNDNGGYPQWTQIDSAADMKALFKGLDEGAMVAPQAASGTTFSWVSSATPTNTQYGYVPAGCGAGDNSCTSFSIYYQKEEGATTEQKKSLNN